MSNSGIVLLDSRSGKKIVQKHCENNDIAVELLESLVIAELEQIGKRRKTGLFEQFDEILDYDYEE